MIKPGMAVLCQRDGMLAAPGRVAASERPGRWWVTVCVGGFHIPQAFDEAGLAPLDDPSGLCAECQNLDPPLALPGPPRAIL